MKKDGGVGKNTGEGTAQRRILRPAAAGDGILRAGGTTGSLGRAQKVAWWAEIRGKVEQVVDRTGLGWVMDWCSVFCWMLGVSGLWWMWNGVVSIEIVVVEVNVDVERKEGYVKESGTV